MYSLANKNEDIYIRIKAKSYHPYMNICVCVCVCVIGCNIEGLMESRGTYAEFSYETWFPGHNIDGLAQDCSNFITYALELLHMMTSSNGNILLAIFAGNSPVPVEFPAQRPVTRSFDVFFDLRLNNQLSKQSWGWLFETLSCRLWRQCNESCGKPSMCTTNQHNRVLTTAVDREVHSQPNPISAVNVNKTTDLSTRFILIDSFQT